MIGVASARPAPGTGCTASAPSPTHEADEETTAAAQEQRRRAQVEGQERDARRRGRDDHGGETVLPREAGDREQRQHRHRAGLRPETVDPPDPVDRLGDPDHEHERTRHIERVHPGRAELGAGRHRDRRGHDDAGQRQTVGVHAPFDEQAERRETCSGEREHDGEPPRRRREREPDQRPEREQAAGAATDRGLATIGILGRLRRVRAPAGHVPSDNPARQHHDRGDGERQEPAVPGRHGEYDGRLHRGVMVGLRWFGPGAGARCRLVKDALSKRVTGAAQRRKRRGGGSGIIYHRVAATYDPAPTSPLRP